MKKATARWVRKAEADFVGARNLLPIRPPLYDLVCFHCQQAAEKYLKALMQEIGMAVPRIHRLEKLLTLVLPGDPALRPLRRSLVSLSRYAVDYRYPGENATRRKALAAYRHVDLVRRELRKRLALPP